MFETIRLKIRRFELYITIKKIGENGQKPNISKFSFY